MHTKVVAFKVCVTVSNIKDPARFFYHVMYDPGISGCKCKKQCALFCAFFTDTVTQLILSIMRLSALLSVSIVGLENIFTTDYHAYFNNPKWSTQSSY